MERRIPPLKKTLLSVLVVLIFLLQSKTFLFSQEAQQNKQLRVELWAELDAYPGFSLDNTDSSIYDYAVKRLKEIAPYILGGMINGWTFDYTPSDKMRSVEEYFSYEPIHEFDLHVNPLEYKQPVVIEDRLDCWVYCNRTADQQLSFAAWSSVKNTKIRGVGQGAIEDGFDGIKAACENAIKNAVREYWRTIIKNKPKEIEGRVLLVNAPRIYIKSGKYTVDLDFFMETSRIIEYSNY